MKTLDAKGRLFGIINIFDLFVLVILIFSSVLAFRWATSAKDPSWIKVKEFNAKCIVRLEVTKQIADLIMAGDQAVNDDGVVVGTIIKLIDNKPASVIVFNSEKGEKIFFNSQSRHVIALMELLAYDKRGEVYCSLTSMPIKAGAGFTFHSKRYNVPAQIEELLNDAKI